MFREAFCSLRHDKARSFFYWLTFLLTALFIFLFFSVGLSADVGVQMFYAKNDIPTNLMLLSVILCAVEIFFANDFYVRQKAKELSVMLICGARYSQLAGFLLIQTVFLSATAIVCAVGIGLAFIPLLETIFTNWTGTVFHISVSFNAVVWTAIVIAYVLMWTLIYNLAFAYRNSAVQLLKEDRNKAPRQKLLRFSMEPSLKTKQILSFLCLVLPVIGYYQVPDALLFFSLISLAGLNGCIQNIIFPGLEKHIRNKIEDGQEVAAAGFLRNDFTILKMNIYLLVTCMILLISLLLTGSSDLDFIMTMIACISMNMLLCMSLFFRFATEMVNRKRAYKTLGDLGFNSRQKKKIIRMETGRFYGFMVLVVLFYTGNMLISENISGNIQNPLLNVVLVVISVLPVVISRWLSRAAYKKYVLQEEN